jgi:hypothetical protein
MAYQGTLQNGVVVLMGGETLPEGTVVRVLPQPLALAAAVDDAARSGKNWRTSAARSKRSRTICRLTWRRIKTVTCMVCSVKVAEVDARRL